MTVGDADADADEDADEDAGFVAPDTPAGRQLEWLVGAFNSGDITAEDWGEHFSLSFRSRTDRAEFEGNNRALLTDMRPLVVTGLDEESTETLLWAHVHGTGRDVWYRLRLEVFDVDPHPIVDFYAALAGDLAEGPIGEREIGLTAYCPLRMESLPGAEVELVDR